MADYNQEEFINIDKDWKYEPTWGDAWRAIKGTAIDVGRDYRNLGIETLAPFVEFAPGVSRTPLSNYLYGLKYKDPEGDVRWDIEEDGSWNWLKAMGNQFFPPSSINPGNPYANAANEFRNALDTVPGIIALMATKGKSVIPGLVNRAPNVIKKGIGQLFPWTSGRGTFWPKKKLGELVDGPWGNTRSKTSWFNRNWNPLTTDPSTYRNLALSTMIDPMVWKKAAMRGQHEDTGLQAAEIIGNSDYDPVFGDRDPVIFDDYVSERIREPQDEQRGPGPWNEFEG